MESKHHSQNSHTLTVFCSPWATVVFISFQKTAIPYFSPYKGCILFPPRQWIFSNLSTNNNHYIFISAQTTSVFHFSQENGCYSISPRHPLFCFFPDNFCFLFLPRKKLFSSSQTITVILLISRQPTTIFYFSPDNGWFYVSPQIIIVHFYNRQ